MNKAVVLTATLLLIGLAMLWHAEHSLSLRVDYYGELAACASGQLDQHRDIYGTRVHPQPDASMLDFSLGGVALSYASGAVHAGGTTRLSGQVHNPTSLPLVGKVRFTASARKRINITFGGACAVEKIVGRDTVMFALAPGDSQPFSIVVPTPTDTASLEWRARNEFVILVRDHRRR